MFGIIEIPIWLAVGGGLLMIFGLLDRVLVPSVRWYFKRRFERLINRLNKKLDLKIQPFKLMQRRVMIDRLVYDSEVMDAAIEYAQNNQIPEKVVIDEVATYAREIIPSFSAMAYFGFAIRLARLISKLIYRVNLGLEEKQIFSGLDKNATVVFIINHRSNMDYFILTWLASDRSALSYAVGEWARVWPFQQLIRAWGGYFIRRTDQGPLYRKVLTRYVQMATDGGVTQAIFPEGALSLDGKLKRGKLGILSYMVSKFDIGQKRDIVLVPVGLNYDRVLEDRILLKASNHPEEHFEFSLLSAVGFLFRQIWLRLTGRFNRFGYASVSFGQPISMRTFMANSDIKSSDRRTVLLGRKVMDEVSKVVPVLPVPLVATAIKSANAPLQDAQIQELCADLLKKLKSSGAQVHVPVETQSYVIEHALETLLNRGALKRSKDGIVIDNSDGNLIDFYANSIIHLM